MMKKYFIALEGVDKGVAMHVLSAVSGSELGDPSMGRMEAKYFVTGGENGSKIFWGDSRLEKYREDPNCIEVSPEIENE